MCLFLTKNTIRTFCRQFYSILRYLLQIQNRWKALSIQKWTRKLEIIFGSGFLLIFNIEKVKTYWRNYRYWLRHWRLLKAKRTFWVLRALKCWTTHIVFLSQSGCDNFWGNCWFFPGTFFNFGKFTFGLKFTKDKVVLLFGHVFQDRLRGRVIEIAKFGCLQDRDCKITSLMDILFR